MFLILMTTSFTGYADDNTSFMVREKATIVIKALEDIGVNLQNGFQITKWNLNTDKSHVFLNSQAPN